MFKVDSLPVKISPTISEVVDKKTSSSNSFVDKINNITNSHDELKNVIDMNCYPLTRSFYSKVFDEIKSNDLAFDMIHIQVKKGSYKDKEGEKLRVFSEVRGFKPEKCSRDDILKSTDSIDKMKVALKSSEATLKNLRKNLMSYTSNMSFEHIVAGSALFPHPSTELDGRDGVKIREISKEWDKVYSSNDKNKELKSQRDKIYHDAPVYIENKKLHQAHVGSRQEISNQSDEKLREWFVDSQRSLLKENNLSAAIQLNISEYINNSRYKDALLLESNKQKMMREVSSDSFINTIKQTNNISFVRNDPWKDKYVDIDSVELSGSDKVEIIIAKLISLNPDKQLMVSDIKEHLIRYNVDVPATYASLRGSISEEDRNRIFYNKSDV